MIAGRYRHLKTGGLYEFLTLASMEDDGKGVAVYQSVESGRVWVRPLSEFAVKFEKVTNESEVAK